MAVNNQLNTPNTPITVPEGGTGANTMTTAYAPVCAGTTATGPLLVASTGLSTAGFVLTSNGSSALPSFQAVPGGSGVSTITVPISSADILTMYATPILLIPSQGANTFVSVWSFMIEFVPGMTNYVGGDGNGPCLQWDSDPAAGGILFWSSTVDLTSSNDTIRMDTILFAESGNNASIVNKGVYLSNSTVAYTLGDGTMNVTITYSVVTTIT